MGVQLTWIGHASFRLAAERVVYIDPWKIDSAPHDGDLVVVSHGHHDHFSAEDVDKVSRSDGEVLAPPDVVAKLGRGQVARPGQDITVAGVEVRTVAAYNPGKPFHPRSGGGLGVVVTMAGIRVYYAGDTDLIDEMGQLTDIDVALLPIGGTYTMDAAEAAEACRRIAPSLAIGYHWGDIVGSRADADAFAAAAPCEVKILQPGESVEVP